MFVGVGGEPGSDGYDGDNADVLFRGVVYADASGLVCRGDCFCGVCTRGLLGVVGVCCNGVGLGGVIFWCVTVFLSLDLPGLVLGLLSTRESVFLGGLSLLFTSSTFTRFLKCVLMGALNFGSCV